MSDETVEVPVAELEALRDWVSQGTYCPPCIRALVARIPPPPWEPTDEQIVAWCGVSKTDIHRRVARDELLRLHEAGFDLTLRTEADDERQRLRWQTFDATKTTPMMTDDETQR